MAWFEQVNKSRDAVIMVEVDPTWLDLTERGRTNIKQVMQCSCIFIRTTDYRDNISDSNNNFINQLMQKKPKKKRNKNVFLEMKKQFMLSVHERSALLTRPKHKDEKKHPTTDLKPPNLSDALMNS